MRPSLAPQPRAGSDLDRTKQASGVRLEHITFCQAQTGSDVAERRSENPRLGHRFQMTQAVYQCPKSGSQKKKGEERELQSALKGKTERHKDAGWRWAPAPACILVSLRLRSRNCPGNASKAICSNFQNKPLSWSTRTLCFLPTYP